MVALSKLSSQLKWLLMAGVPFFALGYIAIGMLLEKANLHQDAEAVYQISQLTTRFSDTLHELQKERGASCGFIGSQGEQFGAELEQQRNRTDHHLIPLLRTLPTFNLDFLHNNRVQFVIKLKQLEELADEIGFVRDEVDQLALGCVESLEWFTGITQQLTVLIKVAYQVEGGVPVNAQVSSLEYFMRAKDLAGVERGLITGAISNGVFAPGMYRRFVENLALEQYAFRRFYELATEKEAQLLRQMLKHQAFVGVERIRKILLQTEGVTKVGGTQQWFATASKRIDLMKEAETELIREITAEARQQSRKASYYYYLYLTLVVLSLITTVWVALRLVSEMVYREKLGQRLIVSSDQMAEAESIAHLGSWMLDLESNTLHWSDELYRIFGLKPGDMEATYEGFLERVHPQDRDKVS